MLYKEAFDIVTHSQVQDKLIPLAQQYYPEYGSHGWEDHIADVYNTAVKLRGSDNLTDTELASILLHDIARRKQDKDHNVLGAAMALQLLNKEKLFTPKQRNTIRQAILEHSSGWRKKNNIDGFSNAEAELLAMADKGQVYPDIERTAQRALKWVFEGSDNRFGKNVDYDINDDLSVAKHIHKQLKHWFGDYVYRGKPSMWSKLYNKQLAQRYKAISSSTPEDYVAIVQNFRKQYEGRFNDL